MALDLAFLEKIRKLSDDDIARLALQELKREDDVEEFFKGTITALRRVCYILFSMFIAFFVYCCLFRAGDDIGFIIIARLGAGIAFTIWSGITALAIYGSEELWEEMGESGY